MERPDFSTNAARGDNLSRLEVNPSDSPVSYLQGDAASFSNLSVAEESRAGDYGSKEAFQSTLKNAKILIVDDEPMNVYLLEEILGHAGYTQLHSTQNSQEAIALYHSFEPDLMLLDLHMPGMDGLAVMRLLREELHGHIEIPIIVLTADIYPQIKRQALSEGAKDFLTKPFDTTELLLRISNQLETRFLQLDLRRQNATLEEHVQARTSELELAWWRIRDYSLQLEAAQLETLEMLARAGEYRDDATGQHTNRVSHTTLLLAEQLNLSPDQSHWIHQASRLHDIGKIGISDLILLKPGRLTKEEWEIMKKHTLIGVALFEGGVSELIQIAQRIAASHHERWDGTGYPHGLKGDEIPLEARLLAVADVFDALTHERPYKSAWSVEDAVAEIERQKGSQFDSAVVEAFMRLPHESLV